MAWAESLHSEKQSIDEIFGHLDGDLQNLIPTCSPLYCHSTAEFYNFLEGIWPSKTLTTGPSGTSTEETGQLYALTRAAGNGPVGYICPINR